MIDTKTSPPYIGKLEFWAATTTFVLAVFELLSSSDEVAYLYKTAQITYSPLRNYYLPELSQYCIIYLVFLAVNFVVIPRLYSKRNLLLNTSLAVAIFLATGLVFTIADTYAKAYLLPQFASKKEYFEVLFQQGFLHALVYLLVLALYSGVKYAGFHVLTVPGAVSAKNRLAFRDGLVAFLFWLMSLFLFVRVNAAPDFLALWGISVFAGTALYCFSLTVLIPIAIKKKRPFLAYLWRVILLLAVSFLPTLWLGLVVSDNEDEATLIALFNCFLQLLVVTPLAWVLFMRYLKGNEELFALQKELGKSAANLDFLRSQINPHFLFNSMNTLYGTALQEKAENTAKGVQMLSDMMRFMLHDNLQNKIPLHREVEYIQNYIELQLLRTSLSPNISVDYNLAEQLPSKSIAPMLLIPFVENAFKHGISLKNKSWIKVSLQFGQGKLLFDVYNSTHQKPENDPEKERSGVGLENVKQRLSQLYSGKHELAIRETADEFFVHLTLQL